MKHLLLIVTAGAAPPDDLIDRANTGDGRAQLTLADTYRDGTGVPRDYAEHGARRVGRQDALPAAANHPSASWGVVASPAVPRSSTAPAA